MDKYGNENFKQRLRRGTHDIIFLEAENPRESVLGYRWSKEKTPGHTVVVQGEEAIKRFRDWLNSLEL